MKILKCLRFVALMLIAALGLVLSTCKDDKVNSGSEERSIVSISFEGQVGNVSIKRPSADVGTVEFQWDIASGNPASIEVKTLSISDKATASVKVGDKMNFDNSTNTATITVTAENGKRLDWKVIMEPFEIGGGSEENDIVGISFVGQAGEAVIDTEKAEVTFVYNTIHGSIASVELTSIEVSDFATVSVVVGNKLDFNNPLKTAKIIVTAQNNVAKEWTVKMTDVEVVITGKWRINNTWFIGGNPSNDGSAVFALMEKLIRWPYRSSGPAAEYGNILEFILEGIDTDGKAFGKVINHVGENKIRKNVYGLPASEESLPVLDENDNPLMYDDYADYIYFPDGDNRGDNYIGDRDDQCYDLNYLFRGIPKGESEWTYVLEEREVEGTDPVETKIFTIVTFIFPDGTERECEFGGREDFGGSYQGVKFSDYTWRSGGGRMETPCRENTPGNLAHGILMNCESLLSNKSFFFDTRGMGYPGLRNVSWTDDQKYAVLPMFYWYEVQKIEE